MPCHPGHALPSGLCPAIRLRFPAGRSRLRVGTGRSRVRPSAVASWGCGSAHRSPLLRGSPRRVHLRRSRRGGQRQRPGRRGGKAHDHRQYDSANTGTASPHIEDHSGLDDIDGYATGRTEDTERRDQLIHAALSTRGGQDRWLEVMDDHSDDPDGSYDGRPLAVFHRRHGRRRMGPPQGQPNLRQLLEEETGASASSEPTNPVGQPPF